MAFEAWHDNEVSDPDEDAFERVDYAIRAASLIIHSYDQRSSTVFGLVGPWGCGKSTLTNFICSEIKKQGDGAWQVLRFTPWAAGDPNALLSEFFATLSSAFPAGAGQRLRRHLGRLAAISAPVAELIPVAGGAVSKAAELTAEHLAQQKPWSEAFASVSEELIKQEVPVLIVVDDVDRLHGTELLTLLKVVRLLGRFPGIQYLLAYDDLTLFRSIEAEIPETRGLTGRDFVEKIVQYPLAVPMLTDTQRIRRLNQGLSRAQESTSRSIESLDRVEEVLDVFQRQLATPRSIDRWAAQVGHQFTLLDQNEVDDEDVLILTLLRCAFPRLYASLPSYKSDLVRGRQQSQTGSSPAPDPLQRMLDVVSDHDSEDARTLLEILFPQCAAGGSGPPEATRRVAVGNYFDRYLSQTVTSDDVSDLEIRESVLAALSGDTDSLWAFLTSGEVERQLLAAEKASRVDVTERDDESVANLAALLISRLSDFSTDQIGLFRGVRRSVLQWSASLVAGIAPRLQAERVRDVMVAGGDLGDALEVWRSAVKRVDPSGRGGPPWAIAVTSEMNRLAVDHVMKNLRQRDDAPLDEMWPLYFLGSHRGEEMLKEALREAMTKKEFEIEDLAARFVTTSKISFGDGVERLAGVESILFADVVPFGEDPWLELPVDHDVDDTDLRWQSRRRFAQGRFRSR